MVDVIIVGAGLAGMSAAHELADEGKKVLLLEAEHYLGGRTASWDENGMYVESGLHKYLGFYTAMPRLFNKAGFTPDDVLIWTDELEIRLPNGQPNGVFGAAPLYRPLKTFGGVLGNNRFLPVRDKFSLGEFLLKGLWDFYRHPRELDQYSVACYAQKYGVTSVAFERILIPFTAGLFFLPPERYSAYAFFGIIAAMIPGALRQRVGSFKGGMTEVMMNPLADSLRKKGSSVQCGSKVERLVVEQGRVVGVQVNGEIIRAPHVILAASLLPAQTLIWEALDNHPAFEAMQYLLYMPAVTFQIDLDEPALSEDHVFFGPCTNIVTFAEQSRTTFKHVPGRLSTILAPPEDYIDLSDEQIYELVLPDTVQLKLNIKGKVRQYRAIKHPADFYSLAPGNDHLRPEQATPIPGLTLAGDYTRQPLFCTMEGAVRSGVKAAQVVLKANNHH